VATPTQLPYYLRPMRMEDVDQADEIEHEAFPTLYPPTNYRKELRNRIAEYIACVQRDAEVWVQKGTKRSWTDLFRRRRPEPPEPAREELIVGFLGVWYMGGEAHIVTIAVRESHRRKGIGELLMIGATEMALLREQQVLTLEVRVSNVNAQHLYRKYGFKDVGVRRRYYQDNDEDALIMSTDKLTGADHQALFARLKEQYTERHGIAERVYL